VFALFGLAAMVRGKMKRSKSKAHVLHVGTGAFSVVGGDADLVVSRAREVVEALDRLPPDAPLTEAQRLTRAMRDFG
jgi:hypothetical protein